MRTLANTSAAVLLALTLAAPALAQGDEEIVQLANKNPGIATLVDRLTSCNKCDREKSAFLLGEGKFTEAVIPLMKILHECPDESSRIVAALALCRMKEARGTYAVRRAAKFDESERVRTLCAWFFNEYVEPGTYAFVLAERPWPTQLAVER